MTETDKSAAPAVFEGASTVGSWTRAIIRALRARGVDGGALAAEAGIDVVGLEDPEARVPTPANTELWRRATHATADPCFGLYVSRFISYTTFPALSAAVLASDTLRAAFRRVIRYACVIGDAAMVRFEEGGDCGRLILEPVPGSQLADEAIDAMLALELRVARLLRENPNMSPLRVDLTRDEPLLSEPFRSFFRAPIAFGAARNAIEFAESDLDVQLPTRNAELSRWVDLVLERSLARLKCRQVVSRVRSELLERLPHGEPPQPAVARSLGVSARTLHRQLAEAGTSFQSLLAETRLELAGSYLTEGWTVTEVSFALGFSSVSSFSRAFRSWTGRSPSEARRASERPPR